MKLLKQATEQHNLDTSKVVVYDNVHFPLGFVRFLEALEIHKLVPPSYVSESTVDGYVWCDTRKDGGIRLETSTHPFVHNNKADRVVVEGVEESLLLVEQILSQHSVTYTIVSP